MSVKYKSRKNICEVGQQMSSQPPNADIRAYFGEIFKEGFRKIFYENYDNKFQNINFGLSTAQNEFK